MLRILLRHILCSCFVPDLQCVCSCVRLRCFTTRLHCQSACLIGCSPVRTTTLSSSPRRSDLSSAEEKTLSEPLNTTQRTADFHQWLWCNRTNRRMPWKGQPDTQKKVQTEKLIYRHAYNQHNVKNIRKTTIYVRMTFHLDVQPGATCHQISTQKCLFCVFTPKHDLLYCTEPENRSVSPENSHWLLSQSPFRCLVIDFLCRDTSARHLSLGCCVKSSLISGYRRRSDDFHVHNITSKSVWIIAVWDKGITRIIMWLRIWIWI